MLIHPDAGGSRDIGRLREFQENRAVRRAELDGRVEEATLSPVRTLAPGEVREHQAFSNGVIGDLDRIKIGTLGGLGGNFHILTDLFETRAERRVREATTPDLRDNDQAREIKDEYRDAMAEAKRERAQASRQAQKLGPGHHLLENGDRVDVREDPRTGRTTVTTRRPDGSSKTVEYDRNDPDHVQVTRHSRDGGESTLEQDGTTVRRTESGRNGEGTSTTYRIDREGRPVRDTEGPGADNHEITTVNDDGSTDTRRMVYRDEDGEPVWKHKHRDSEGGFHIPHVPALDPPMPHPWPEHDHDHDRFPFPPFPPFPGPRPWPSPGPYPLPIISPPRFGSGTDGTELPNVPDGVLPREPEPPRFEPAPLPNPWRPLPGPFPWEREDGWRTLRAE